MGNRAHKSRLESFWPVYKSGLIALRQAAADLQPRDAMAALTAMRRAAADGEILTGLLHLDPGKPDLHAMPGTSTRHLAALGEGELCPGVEALERINEACR